jgi:hypothetical protein
MLRALPWELTRPAGLYLLGLLGPLIGLYVLRVQRTRKPIPSVWLWRSAAKDLVASKPFRRLTPSVSLVLEALAVVALAVALAGPRSRAGASFGGRLALVVDVSASMGVREGAATRLELARKASQDLVAGLEPGTETMIVAAAREADLASPFERDRARLRAALDRLEVHEVEGRLGPAIAVAADQLRQRGGGRLLVFSDGATADTEALSTPGVSTQSVSVGAASENTSLVRPHVTRGTDGVTGRERVEAFALVSHHGARARDVFVTLSQQNTTEPLATRRLRVEPEQRVPVVLGFDAAPNDAGTGLVLEVSPGDALTSDDRVHLRVPSGRKLPVVLSPKQASPWLRRAFESDGAIELLSANLPALTPENVPEDALVVIDGACPPRIPGGDLLIVNPPPGRCRSVEVQPGGQRAPVTSWAETDPRMRFLTFDGVEFGEARKLGVESPRDALVRTRDSVLIADVSSPGRTGTLVAFDVGVSNWPLTASFVLFVRNLTEVARAGRASGPALSVKGGEPVSLRVPLGVDRVTLSDPRGSKHEIPARDGQAVMPAPARVGFYNVSWQEPRPSSLLLAVNLDSDSESRITPKALSFGGSAKGTERAALGVTRYDWALALLALALVAADVFWVTRPSRAPTGREHRPRAPERLAPAERGR